MLAGRVAFRWRPRRSKVRVLLGFPLELHTLAVFAVLLLLALKQAPGTMRAKNFLPRKKGTSRAEGLRMASPPR